MKTYLTDIIPSIQRFSKRLDDLTKLTNQNWVSIGDIGSAKRVFIFETKGELDIYENGVEVDSGSWKLVDQSLKLKLKSGGYLLKLGFFDEHVIALKLDSTDSYAFFVNETKYDREFNDITDVLKFLENKYLKKYKTTNDLGSTKKETINETINYGFNIVSEKEYKTIFGNKYIQYKLEFADGSIGSIYKDISYNQFYFEDWFGDKIYNSNFDKTISDLYLDKKKNNR